MEKRGRNRQGATRNPDALRIEQAQLNLSYEWIDINTYLTPKSIQRIDEILKQKFSNSKKRDVILVKGPNVELEILDMAHALSLYELFYVDKIIPCITRNYQEAGKFETKTVVATQWIPLETNTPSRAYIFMQDELANNIQYTTTRDMWINATNKKLRSIGRQEIPLLKSTN